jgi:hypothetical protein
MNHPRLPPIYSPESDKYGQKESTHRSDWQEVFELYNYQYHIDILKQIKLIGEIKLPILKMRGSEASSKRVL